MSIFDLAKILRLCVFRSTFFFIFYAHCFALVNYSFLPFFKTGTLSSALLFILEPMSPQKKFCQIIPQQLFVIVAMAAIVVALKLVVGFVDRAVKNHDTICS